MIHHAPAICRASLPLASRTDGESLPQRREHDQWTTAATTTRSAAAAHRDHHVGPTGSGKSPEGPKHAVVVDLDREPRQRPRRGTRHRSGVLEHVERRLVARTQELLELDLVEPDRASGVGADLGEDHEPFDAGSPSGTTPSAEPNQHGLAVGRPDVPFREDRDQTPGRHLVAPVRLTLVVHERLAARQGVCRNAPPGFGPE